MKNRDVIVGVVLVTLIAAGVYAVRSRSASSEVPAGQAARATGGQVNADEALPDATTADASADLDGLRLTLSLTPHPPVVLETFRVRVRAEADGMPVTLESGLISFEMVMPMGDHRYTLVPGEARWYEAEVVLPSCPSGRRRWYATVEGTVAGQPVTARFRFDLAAPHASR